LKSILTIMALMVCSILSAQYTRQVVFDNDCVQTYGSVVTPITVTKQVDICKWEGTHKVGPPTVLHYPTIQVELMSQQGDLPYGFADYMDGNYVRIYMDPFYYQYLLSTGQNPIDIAIGTNKFCGAIEYIFESTPFPGLNTTYNVPEPLTTFNQ